MSSPSSKLLQSLRQSLNKQFPDAYKGLESQINNIDKELGNLFDMQLQKIQNNDARIEELTGSDTRQAREIKTLSSKIDSMNQEFETKSKVINQQLQQLQQENESLSTDSKTTQRNLQEAEKNLLKSEQILLSKDKTVNQL